MLSRSQDKSENNSRIEVGVTSLPFALLTGENLVFASPDLYWQLAWSRTESLLVSLSRSRGRVTHSGVTL